MSPTPSTRFRVCIKYIYVYIDARACALDVRIGTTSCRAICVYFPTSWDSDEAVEEVYVLLTLLLEECYRKDMRPIIGGDFNASIGTPQVGDDLTSLGGCGHGRRNARGERMIRWILEHRLQILNRQADEQTQLESWTCCRSRDKVQVQIDFSCVPICASSSKAHGATMYWELAWIIDVSMASARSQPKSKIGLNA